MGELFRIGWRNMQAEVQRVERVVPWCSGLSVGICLPVLLCLTVARQENFPVSHQDAVKELSVQDESSREDSLLDIMARRLVRKNSHFAVEQAYTICQEAKLGEGAFGEVHRAVHKRTGIERAVKRIDKQAAPDALAPAREVEAMRLMDHPHVCRLVEYFETSRHLWLVTELCRGEELCSRLLERPGGMSELEAARLMSQMICATLHCHRRSVVHGDIKPENFLFRHGPGAGGGDALMLIDFGYSVQVPPTSAVLADGGNAGTAGTLLYMSPQMLRGDPASHSDDMWSLGVIFHILLTGRYPFATNDDICFRERWDRGLLEGDVKEYLKAMQASPFAVDLAARLLDFNPAARITAEAALRHPFLAGVRDAAAETASQDRFDAEEVHRRCAHFHASGRLRRIAAAAIAQLPDESWPECKRARATFLGLDKTGDGRVLASDLCEFLCDRGLDAPESWFASPYRGFPAIAAPAGISYTTFLAVMLNGSAMSGDERICRAVFDLFDGDRNGAISAEDLRHRLGLQPQECEEIIAEALGELGNEGKGSKGISFPDFHRMMRSCAEVGTASAARGGPPTVARQQQQPALA